MNQNNLILLKEPSVKLPIIKNYNNHNMITARVNKPNESPNSSRNKTGISPIKTILAPMIVTPHKLMKRIELHRPSVLSRLSNNLDGKRTRSYMSNNESNKFQNLSNIEINGKNHQVMDKQTSFVDGIISPSLSFKIPKISNATSLLIDDVDKDLGKNTLSFSPNKKKLITQG